MSSLSSFAHEEQEIIVSLPYKVGICVSYAEDEEGEGDDGKESKALENALKKYAQPESEKVLIWEIAVAALKYREDWPRWSQDTFNIEPACEAAVKILKSRATDEDVKAYVRMVMDISNRVAQAYGEFGMEPENTKGIKGFVKKLIGGNKDESDQPMNVSAAEDDVIVRISKALKKYA